MTKSAIEQAAEALRRIATFLKSWDGGYGSDPENNWNYDEFRDEYAAIQDTLARLTAEQPPVPPSDARFQELLSENTRDAIPPPVREWLRIRDPAMPHADPELDLPPVPPDPADGYRAGAEAMREACAKMVASHGKVTDLAHGIAAAIRALPLPPAADGWRPMGHDASIAELQAEIGRLQSILHYRVLGDPRVGVSSSPPAEEKP